jgi:hypothetical protein
LTVLELLDALEIGIVTLRARNEGSTRNACAGGCACVRQPLAAADADFFSAKTLRVEMERSAVTPAKFTKMLGVDRNTLESWLAGTSPIPSWVQHSTRVLALLTPSARRKLLNSREWKPEKNSKNAHPFSRIEEL